MTSSEVRLTTNSHHFKLAQSDFPSLYRNASSTSARAQKSFLWALGLGLGLLVFSTLLSVLNLPFAGFAILQVVVLLLSLGSTIFLAYAQPQRTWYGARALAESVKTVTWRFMMRAEPYAGNLGHSKAHLVENLKKILSDNTVLSKVIAVSDGEEITAQMLSLRSMKIMDRRTVYEKKRIADQLSWYRSKATANDKSSMRWYVFLIVLEGLAILLAVFRIIYPQLPYWPTDIFVTAASSVMAWLQTKRFQELAASYSLTAHDIGLLKSKLLDVNTEAMLSAFVGDAENAFSREHTQWRARRDVD